MNINKLMDEPQENNGVHGERTKLPKPNDLVYVCKNDETYEFMANLIAYGSFSLAGNLLNAFGYATRLPFMVQDEGTVALLQVFYGNERESPLQTRGPEPEWFGVQYDQVSRGMIVVPTINIRSYYQLTEKQKQYGRSTTSTGLIFLPNGTRENPNND